MVPMSTLVAAVAAYPCLCVDDVERSVAFYVDLLDLTVGADLGWYVELGSAACPICGKARVGAGTP